jgi:predicted nucleic acid-binding protein
LIEGERTVDAQALRLADHDWRSEPFLVIEFSYLLATRVRGKALAAGEAAAMLTTASQQLAGWVEMPHEEASATALKYGISAHDARFVAAAQHLNVPLVTEDGRLLAAMGGRALSIAEALAALGH